MKRIARILFAIILGFATANLAAAESSSGFAYVCSPTGKLCLQQFPNLSLYAGAGVAYVGTGTTTRTATGTGIWIGTGTASLTRTQSASGTATTTTTGTGTYSTTQTSSHTTVLTNTITLTGTLAKTFTLTSVLTITVTGTGTATATGSSSGTGTLSGSATATGLASSTMTGTKTGTATITGTWAKTWTGSGTWTFTATASAGKTVSATVTVTTSATGTATGTGTKTSTWTATSASTATSATIVSSPTISGAPDRTTLPRAASAVPQTGGAPLCSASDHVHPLADVVGGDRYLMAVTECPAWATQYAPYVSDPTCLDDVASPTLILPAVFTTTISGGVWTLATYKQQNGWIPPGRIGIWVWLKSTSVAIVQFDFYTCDSSVPGTLLGGTFFAVGQASQDWTYLYDAVSLPYGVILTSLQLLCLVVTATTPDGTPTVTLGTTMAHATRINGPFYSPEPLP